MTTEERLARIEQLLETLSAQVRDRIRDTDERIGRLSRIFFGQNGTPGLLVKLDRLEQAHERSRWLLRAVVTAVIGLAAAAFFGP